MDDWKALRELVLSSAGIKKEDDEDGPPQNPMSFKIVEVPIESVWCMQEKISPKFRNGRPLKSMIEGLKSGREDPMRTPYLVLDMARAEFRDRPVRFYTFDHRRCYCMLQAGVRKVRARIVLDGPAFNDLARKSSGLGKPLHQLTVSRGRR